MEDYPTNQNDLNNAIPLLLQTLDRYLGLFCFFPEWYQLDTTTLARFIRLKGLVDHLQTRANHPPVVTLSIIGIIFSIIIDEFIPPPRPEALPDKKHIPWSVAREWIRWYLHKRNPVGYYSNSPQRLTYLGLGIEMGGKAERTVKGYIQKYQDELAEQEEKQQDLLNRL